MIDGTVLDVVVGNQLGELLEDIDGICEDIALGPLVGSGDAFKVPSSVVSDVGIEVGATVTIAVEPVGAAVPVEIGPVGEGVTVEIGPAVESDLGTEATISTENVFESTDGPLVGFAIGRSESASDVPTSRIVGTCVGIVDGGELGKAVGWKLGKMDGTKLGPSEGMVVGVVEGKISCFRYKSTSI